MRLVRLDLLAFGPFHGASLDFGAPGLHVVFGRNEAGKSTTLRAVTGLLYGIDARTQDAHVHKADELRIGGVLERGDGTRLEVVRRKGNKHTLLAPDGTALGDDALRPFLRAVTEDTFRHAFGLDHESLRRGAEALLAGKGDLGESLFDASAGGAGDVQRLLASLEATADGLYRPRGSTQSLNQALKAFDLAQKRVAERQSLPSAYVKQEEHLEALRTSLAALLVERDALRASKARLERAKRRAPLERRLAELGEARAGLAALLEHTPRLTGLETRLGAYESDLRARASLEAERAIADARLREASRGTGDGETRLDPRIPPRLTKRVHERDALVRRIAETDAAIAELEREGARAATEATASVPDATALAVAAERAQALGDPETRIDAERGRLERRRRELEMRAAQLGTSTRDLDAVVALSLPSEEAVAALEARSKAAEARAARLESRVADLDASLAEVERHIAEAAGDFAPPDVRDLASARHARDEALTKLLDGEVAKATAAVALDRLVRDADALADRMIREADRVTSLSRLRSARSTQETQREAARRELAEAEAAIASVRSELVTAFAPALSPASFEAARALVSKHAQVRSTHAELVSAEGELEELVATTERARRELAAALAEDGALRTLLATARSRLKEVDARHRMRDDAVRARARTEEKLDALRLQRTNDAERLAEVGAELDDLGRAVRIGRDASADEVLAALEAARAVEGAEAAARDATLRATAAISATHAFEDELRGLVRDAAPDLADLAPRDAAATLVERFARARSVVGETTALEGQLAELGTEDGPSSWGADEQRELERVSGELERLDVDVSRTERDIGGAAEGLRAMRGESHAAEAAAEAHEALARVRTQVERYCRAKLAHAILSREIDRFRDENQGPLLARASQLFARLTLGAFTTVRAGLDDRDRACLTCVREGGATAPVGGLSEGTRDQLYLALRLASLERHALSAEPMPLLLDDVLVQLDDERARAALVVLAETAQRMQVLFFTHHARLVELAREAVEESKLVVHELASRRELGAKTTVFHPGTGA